MSKATQSTQFPKTNVQHQQPQDIKLSRSRGQKPPHPMGTETNRPGRNAFGRPTAAALSTPKNICKRDIAPINVHNTH